MTVLQPTFIPSLYQQQIFEWIRSGRGDAIVNAVAGSGKTTTLIQAADRLHTHNALFAAFNTHIAKSLQSRLDPRLTCRTIHSLGNGCLFRFLGETRLEDTKYRNLCRDRASPIHTVILMRYQQQLREWAQSGAEAEQEPEPPPMLETVQTVLRQLVHFAQCTLTEPGDYRAMTEMAAHFGVTELGEHFDLLLPEVESILMAGQDLARYQKIIDYADMLYLPYLWDLQPKRFEWVLVDEAQDLSAAQLHLILKARGKGGRMLFVGDPLQAIYGFAGADCEAFDRIQTTLQAPVLPLSICYRCPTRVIELARRIVPQIEARPDAPEGVVETIKETQLPAIVQEGDLILCRLTAPLISLCIELISQRIPARVKGRDIGKLLTAIVGEVGQMPGFRFAQFGEFLEAYQSRRVVKLQQKGNSEGQIAALGDRVAGVFACYTAFECRSVGELCREIESLFSDDRPSVLLSTVHRAKGLEAERVFILYPDKLPLRWDNQQAWELRQEMNLKYVALTRARAELYFVVEK